MVSCSTNHLSGITHLPTICHNFLVLDDHKCTAKCLKVMVDPDDPSSGYKSENPLDYRGANPLEIPLRAGWIRTYLKATPPAPGRDVISYVAPCGRHIRSDSELEHYLYQTGSQLTTDLFIFDKDVRIDREYRCEKSLIRIADISYKKESVPIPCVNSLDNEAPPYMEYITERMPYKHVKLNLDPGFRVCCDCTDNCRDRSKCACQQLTRKSLQKTISVTSLPCFLFILSIRMFFPLLTCDNQP